MKTYTKAERIVRTRKLILFFIIIVSIVFAFIAYSNRAAAENSRPVYTYYTSYEIQPGDTLWTIADQFITPENSSKTAFINNIKSLNHIGDDNITAGNYLIIEYSSFDKL